MLVVIASSMTIAVELDVFSNFRQKMESYDSGINDVRFTCEASSEWWKLADDFVLTIVNDASKYKNPQDYFGDIKNKEIQGIKVNFNDSGFIGFNYNGQRPVIENKNTLYANNWLSISIRPLTEDRSIYYVGYYRIWYEFPNAEGRILSLGTFRIIEKNAESGKYKITAKQEESNFYKHIIQQGKFKYLDENQVPFCEWDPHFEKYESKENGSVVVFQLLYILGVSGSPMQNQMYVTWIYGPGKKLKATNYKYISYDSRNDPNVRITPEHLNGGTVEIPR